MPVMDGRRDASASFPPCAAMPDMKILSASVLWLQILMFALGTIYVLRQFVHVVRAGAWFDDPRRLAAAVAPYLVLPVGIILSSAFHGNEMYTAGAVFPLVLLAAVTAAGQIYLKVVPDPVMDNFGPRPLPYSGFLVLPREEVPAGFQEVSHHYSKHDYNIHFRRMLNDNWVQLHIAESRGAKFVHSSSQMVRGFDYRGITGHVYAETEDKSGKRTLHLIWLNPPQQRVSILLTQPPGDSYSPEDLITLLRSMTLATENP